MTSIADLADAIRLQAVTAGATEPTVRGADWQTATVTAVGAGTVDCGTITARRLESYQNPAVGDHIVITQSGNGNWLACGRTSSTTDTEWDDYNPIWTTDANPQPSVGNGTLTGRWKRDGRTIVGWINLVAGSTTTFGSSSDWNFSLPVQAASVGTRLCHAEALAGSRLAGQFVISPSQTASKCYFPSTTTPPLVSCRSDRPFAWASGNQLRIDFLYEAAS
ncbi:hypothetical protein [Streptomyces sparsogenes]|uniref:Uncharacterized protein n=1 Tax=Streptomyces sparsogenes DSM 40356 TaxID=1331668 RepID=A0A1R1S7U5_9ACTN|nr:hypothetical protein [Streptomyces sparsogenes]OMI34364.1 hypothetical protein SPAR_36311 [Streptomyces sparsogenes DSM 40356]